MIEDVIGYHIHPKDPGRNMLLGWNDYFMIVELERVTSDEERTVNIYWGTIY